MSRVTDLPEGFWCVRFHFCTKQPTQLAAVNVTCASDQKSGNNVSEADVSFIKSPNQINFIHIA